MVFEIAWMRTNTPLSGPSWSASNSNVGARTILNDPSAMNPESSARISQVLAMAGTQGLAPSVDPNSTYNYLGNN